MRKGEVTGNKSPNHVAVIGRKFGMLLVLSERTKIEKGWKVDCTCLCDCGKTKVTPKSYLLRGAVISCGCTRRRPRVSNFKPQYKHRMFATKEWTAWKSMKARCTNPNNQEYHRYGGRGITVCLEWLNSFEVFYKDMGVKPEGFSLDRIDNNGNYCKENCRWATTRQQLNNKSTNVFVTYKGETKSASEFARQYGIKPDTLLGRLQNERWSLDDCFSPVDRHRKRKPRRLTKTPLTP